MMETSILKLSQVDLFGKPSLSQPNPAIGDSISGSKFRDQYKSEINQWHPGYILD